MASNGYPEKYTVGFPITVDSDCEAEVYVAGAKFSDDGRILSNGGRVLGVTATGDTLENAISKAYTGVSNVHFENAYYRSDIGKRALAANNK